MGLTDILPPESIDIIRSVVMRDRIERAPRGVRAYDVAPPGMEALEEAVGMYHGVCDKCGAERSHREARCPKAEDPSRSVGTP